MPFAPKSALPLPRRLAVLPPVRNESLHQGLVVFEHTPGALHYGQLSDQLQRRMQPVIWARLGPEDADPATLLISLVMAARRLIAEAGQATLDQMRRTPGPLVGWPVLFGQLAEELSATLPPESAFVIEYPHTCQDALALRLLWEHSLPMLANRLCCIVLSHNLPGPPRRSGDVVVYRTSELLVDRRSVDRLADQIGAGLESVSRARLYQLCRGHLSIIEDACLASALLGPALLGRLIDRSNAGEDLLFQIAQAWLATVTSDAQHALALTLQVEYYHPELIQAACEGSMPPAGPWFLPLQENWAWVQPVWREPLKRALRGAARCSSDVLRCAASYLAEQEAIERAVPLYFIAGDVSGAASLIQGDLDQLLSAGQWELLSHWIEALPAPTLRKWPWLVYTVGEIAAARDEFETARKMFDAAAALFTACQDVEGNCQSLLAESALAAWSGDRAHAQMRALAARTVAQTAGLAWHHGWAAWQLGCLAASSGSPLEASRYFAEAHQAAEAVGDAAMRDLIQHAEHLVNQQCEILHQQASLQRAYAELVQHKDALAVQVKQLIGSPPAPLDVVLSYRGWSRTPLMLKLPAPTLPVSTTSGGGGFWNTLLTWFGWRRQLTPPRPVEAVHAHTIEAHLMLDMPLADEAGQNLLAIAIGEVSPTTAPMCDPGNLPRAAGLPTAAPTVAHRADVPACVTPGVGPPRTSPVLPAQGQTATAGLTLTAHMLGSFQVSLNHQPIEAWPSGRGRSVYKYLLFHHDQPIARDTLMDLFWPDVAPDAARNRLNVAIHGLRQAFRPLTDLPVVVFKDGAYSLNCDLQIWLDVAEFERCIEAGRQLEASDRSAAAAMFESASGLYQGEFLADDLYEEWTVLIRERLRIAYLDTLDWLSQYYFSEGRYGSCVRIGQLILSQDACREDVHCRLMRSYARQGQHNLALRQYQACSQVLHEELGIEPAPATTELYQRIRRREYGD